MLDDLTPPRWLTLLAQVTARWGPWRLTTALALGTAAAVAVAAWVSMALAISLALVSAVILGAGLLCAARWAEAQHRVALLSSTRDTLTALPHRRHFMEVAEREWALAERHNQALALALIGVDGFARVNSAHGPGCGDALLQQIAALLEDGLRQGDVLARVGREAFALLLPVTDPLGALDVAERMRERVAELPWNWQGLPLALSVTVGVSARRMAAGSLAQLFEDALAAQARAQGSGGNCVRAEIVYTTSAPT